VISSKRGPIGVDGRSCHAHCVFQSQAIVSVLARLGVPTGALQASSAARPTPIVPFTSALLNKGTYLIRYRSNQQRQRDRCRYYVALSEAPSSAVTCTASSPFGRMAPRVSPSQGHRYHEKRSLRCSSHRLHQLGEICGGQAMFVRLREEIAEQAANACQGRALAPGDDRSATRP
jgi:hypothetical protein